MYIIDDLGELAELRIEDCSLLRNFASFLTEKSHDVPGFLTFYFVGIFSWQNLLQKYPCFLEL